MEEQFFQFSFADPTQDNVGMLRLSYLYSSYYASQLRFNRILTSVALHNTVISENQVKLLWGADMLTKVDQLVQATAFALIRLQRDKESL